MLFLKQSTASQEILLGPFLDDTDGKTAETGLTIANTDIKVWKAGATSEANKNSGGATHIAAGRYYAVLDATDTDTLGSGEVNVHVSGALPVRRAFTVLPAVVYDSLIGGTDNLQVDAVQISGDSSAADNLETACDGGAYNVGGGSVVAASVTGAVGSVTGAVGSVTGAVASVTGNVGGNVVGSVASVVGAVGSVTGAVGSVAGNVGGNVVGSVGSVIGAVGSVTGAVGSVTGAVGSVTGNVGGNVVGSVASVAEKTGFKLASDGLDSVATTAPSGVAANFREMVVQTWRRFYRKAVKDAGAGEIYTYADNGSTILTIQAYTDDGLGSESQGAAV